MAKAKRKAEMRERAEILRAHQQRLLMSSIRREISKAKREIEKHERVSRLQVARMDRAASLTRALLASLRGEL
jgi:hypothetical protein